MTSESRFEGVFTCSSCAIVEMRLSSISSSFMNEKVKGKDHVDHIEDSTQVTDNANNEEAVSEAWLTAEKKIVRKLDMTLLPTVWTLYLFK